MNDDNVIFWTKDYRLKWEDFSKYAQFSKFFQGGIKCGFRHRIAEPIHILL